MNFLAVITRIRRLMKSQVSLFSAESAYARKLHSGIDHV